MRSHARAAGVIAATLVVGAAVAGCAQRPGTAATVDGWRITDGYLAETVEDLGPVSQQPPTAATTLASLASAPSYLEVAEENGAGVSDEEADAFLAQIAEQVGLDPETEFADGVVLLARVQLSQGKLQQAGDADALGQMTERLAEADVVVNPRFGEWDAGQITPTSWPWLLAPEAEAPEAG